MNQNEPSTNNKQMRTSTGRSIQFLKNVVVAVSIVERIAVVVSVVVTEWSAVSEWSGSPEERHVVGSRKSGHSRSWCHRFLFDDGSSYSFDCRHFGSHWQMISFGAVTVFIGNVLNGEFFTFSVLVTVITEMVQSIKFELKA